MDSVTVLLHRLGVAYVADHEPGVPGAAQRRRRAARRRAGGRRRRPDRRRTAETWIHVQLSPSVDRKALAEARAAAARRCSPTPGRWRRLGGDERRAARPGRRRSTPTPADRFPGPDRADVADLLRWLGDGHFVLLGYQRCPVRDGRSSVDESSRLGVLRLRDRGAAPAHRQRRSAGAGAGHHAQLSCATAPTRTSWWSANTPAAHRRRAPLRRAVHGRRDERQRAGDPADLAAGARGAGAGRQRPQPPRPAAARRHPDRPALGAVHAERRTNCSTMATAVVDLGSRRRALLFLRADQLGHFVSCLVYLPRDRYTTAVRLDDAGHPGPRVRRREHRLHRAGQRITLGAGAFHGPAARRHASAGHRRLARPTGPASSGCSPRRRAPGPTGCSARRKPARSTRRSPSTTRRRSPRVQAGRHPDGRDRRHRASSKSCNEIRSSWCSPRATTATAPADLVSGRAGRPR